MDDFLKTDAARLERASSSPSSAGETGRAPAEGDVRTFEQILRDGRQGEQSGEHGGGTGKEDGEYGGADPDTGETQNVQTGPASLFAQMGNPLDSIFQMQTPPTDASRPEAPAHPVENDMTQALVDRILVATPPEGGSEIRIQLSRDVLPDTEIRLVRSSDGMLTVTLETQDATSFQTLVDAQNSLRTRLEQQEGMVRVNVTTGTGSEAEDGNPDRRSRGYVPPAWDEDNRHS